MTKIDVNSIRKLFDCFIYNLVFYIVSTIATLPLEGCMGELGAIATDDLLLLTVGGGVLVLQHNLRLCLRLRLYFCCIRQSFYVLERSCQFRFRYCFGLTPNWRISLDLAFWPFNSELKYACIYIHILMCALVYGLTRSPAHRVQVNTLCISRLITCTPNFSAKFGPIRSS